jgi:sugar phosphate isomerase/epimerase
MNKLAIQSYCLRSTKENSEVAAKVNELGLDSIELCGVHVDFNDESKFDEVIGIYGDAGVQIVSIGVERFADDETHERKLCEFAKKAGAKQISADFAIDKVPDAYRTAERLAEEYHLKLAIHNHGGQHWMGCSDVLDHAFKNSNDRIGLCLDTAWAMHSHADPVKMCEQFADRLYGVHIKDFVFDRSGGHEDVVVGTGNLDLPGLVAAIRVLDWDCPMIIEYEGDIDNPIPALKECVAATRAVGH